MEYCLAFQILLKRWQEHQELAHCCNMTLIVYGLRERAILRVDGGFKSGVEVMIAAAMGAYEYCFSSLAMIATGCVMARICHTNNCPVGVASQVLGLRLILTRESRTSNFLLVD